VFLHNEIVCLDVATVLLAWGRPIIPIGRWIAAGADSVLRRGIGSSTPGVFVGYGKGYSGTRK
jgi:hypothetical protein